MKIKEKTNEKQPIWELLIEKGFLMTAIDAGASTGGFTDCLLQHGIGKVYAVDVGFGQLVGKLSADPRVVSMEKANVSDVVSLTQQL